MPKKPWKPAADIVEDCLNNTGMVYKNRFDMGVVRVDGSNYPVNDTEFGRSVEIDGLSCPVFRDECGEHVDIPSKKARDYAL